MTYKSLNNQSFIVIETTSQNCTRTHGHSPHRDFTDKQTSISIYLYLYLSIYDDKESPDNVNNFIRSLPFLLNIFCCGNENDEKKQESRISKD